MDYLIIIFGHLSKINRMFSRRCGRNRRVHYSLLFELNRGIVGEHRIEELKVKMEPRFIEYGQSGKKK